MFKSNYLNRVYDEYSIRYQHETEYVKTIYEFFSSIDNLILNDDIYEKHNVIERLIEPDRIISFRVTWVDDEGGIRVNRGYRVQHSQARGPYKGGIRFHKDVNLSQIKFLALEQTLKNSLTNLPLGGAKGGADFDPIDKSDREIMRFCQSFMSELYRHLGPDTDVPAGDLGVGQKEVGYMYGYYKRLKNETTGAFTGKGLLYGGSLLRPEATGYGLCYFTSEMLKHYKNTTFKDKRVIISGTGNVGINAFKKAIELGANVIAVSNTKGYIYSEDGLNFELIKAIIDNKQNLLDYVIHKPNTLFSKNPKDLWKVPCDIALPCATQNEIDLEDAQILVENKIMLLAEGANKPCTTEASKYLIENNILFGPSKAANSGGVIVSLLEMHQNSIRLSLSNDELDNKLQQLMQDIFKAIRITAEEYHANDNLIAGANILSLIRLTEAIISQGVI